MNATILSGFHYYYLSTVFSLFTLLFIPGILILSALNVNLDSLWERITFIIGSSIAFLICLGLFINSVLPFVGISQPLALMPFIISFNISIVVLSVITLFISKSGNKAGKPQVLYVKNNSSENNKKLITALFSLASFAFIPLSVLGAFNLNNNGTSIFTLVLLAGIALSIFLLTLLRDKLSPEIFPAFLYTSGLSLLLSSSLRSWSISGHDIQWEYYVFQLTKNGYIWDLNLYRDAYNACLSITILPTILSNFIQFPDIYIYKVIYQVIFALAPVVVYIFLKKYTSPILAFLSTFIFISFPTYLLDMPMLNRQEIGFLFFALFIFILYSGEYKSIENKTIQKKSRGLTILMYIFALGMVLSHYATTYITTGLITGIFILTVSSRFIFGISRIKIFLQNRLVLKKINLFSGERFIYLRTVIFLITTTLLWNSVITRTSDGLTTTIIETTSNIHRIFDAENKSADIAYSLFFSKKIDDQEYVRNYISENETEAKREYQDELLPADTFKLYEPKILRPETLPVTEFGKTLGNIGLNDMLHFNYALRQFFAKFIQIAIIIGILGLLFYRSKNLYNIEYIFGCFVSVFFILLMIILPQISLNYGLLRLFHQLLIFLALPLVMGWMLILHRIFRSLTVYIVSTIVILFFLTLTGFISTVTGGYYPQYHLNNGGLYYESYFNHELEITSINWLRNNMVPNSTVQADTLTGDRLFGTGNIYSLDANIPQVMHRSSYIYAGITNNKGRSVLSVDRNLMIQYPKNILNANKNVIYSNGATTVYK